MNKGGSAEIVIMVDPVLEKILPAFIKRQHAEVEHLKTALQARDFLKVAQLGHSIKGSCGSYGFDALGDFGAQVEEAGLANSAPRIERIILLMEEHLAQIKIQFHEK